jgi:DNA-binding NarL/FixJ family response regulator
MPGEDRARVLLIDDHALIREGLKRAIDNSSDFEVAAEASSLSEARSRLARTPVDVVIVDVRLTDGNGLTLVRELVAGQPALAVVVLTMYAGDAQVLDAREAGASAFVSKDAPTTAVLEAARKALDAPRVFTADGVTALSKRTANRHFGRLTPRELEVLELLVAGDGVGPIARRLFISESTTKTHIANIYGKLGAANRAQAVAVALREGIVALNE